MRSRLGRRAIAGSHLLTAVMMLAFAMLVGVILARQA
jgi:hypothetical protein